MKTRSRVYARAAKEDLVVVAKYHFYFLNRQITGPVTELRKICYSQKVQIKKTFLNKRKKQKTFKMENETFSERFIPVRRRRRNSRVADVRNAVWNGQNMCWYIFLLLLLIFVFTKHESPILTCADTERKPRHYKVNPVYKWAACEGHYKDLIPVFNPRLRRRRFAVMNRIR